MKNTTRPQFNKLKLDTALANGVQDVTEKFSLSPSVEQRLVEQMGESTDFLKRINLISVTEQKGQKLGLGVGSPIASRTDTSSQTRETAFVGSLAADQYETKQTNFDTHIGYSVMDAWAVFPDFHHRYRRHVMKRMALDRIMIGWNGTSAATATDRITNPLLQDVNVGWVEKVRQNDPARLMGYASDGEVTEDVYKVGEGGDYGTLDALAFDLMSNLLDPWHMGGDDLVLIIGRELWVNHGLTLYNDNRAASRAQCSTGMVCQRSRCRSENGHTAIFPTARHGYYLIRQPELVFSGRGNSPRHHRQPQARPRGRISFLERRLCRGRLRQVCRGACRCIAAQKRARQLGITSWYP
ncbi:phage major capsid protein, P2 family [Thiothrix lacustris]|uniref:phage major capsid protein, P2 family n=1 Tax=Thiothrix lacustris TaxID=525917 RepID=UPI003FEEB1B7